MTDKKANAKQAITKDMTLGDLVTKHPQAAMVLAQKGLHCIGCGMAAMETIEQGCKAHGLDGDGHFFPEEDALVTIPGYIAVAGEAHDLSASQQAIHGPHDAWTSDGKRDAVGPSQRCDMLEQGLRLLRFDEYCGLERHGGQDLACHVEAAEMCSDEDHAFAPADGFLKVTAAVHGDSAFDIAQLQVGQLDQVDVVLRCVREDTPNRAAKCTVVSLPSDNVAHVVSDSAPRSGGERVQHVRYDVGDAVADHHREEGNQRSRNPEDVVLPHTSVRSCSRPLEARCCRCVDT